MKTTHRVLLGFWGWLLFFTQAPIALAFYDPSEGRWLSRDPIGESSDANLMSLTHNTPLNIIDFLGLSFNITTNYVPLEMLRWESNCGPFAAGLGYWGCIAGNSGEALPTINSTDLHTIYEHVVNGKYCAYIGSVGSAGSINVEGRSFIPNNVEDYYDPVHAMWLTGTFSDSIEGHELRRVHAYFIAYNTYLVPSQGRGTYATRCDDKFCDCTPGNAARQLAVYLSRLQEKAIKAARDYGESQMTWLDMENDYWDIRTIANVRFNFGLRQTLLLNYPPSFEPPACEE